MYTTFMTRVYAGLTNCILLIDITSKVWMDDQKSVRKIFTIVSHVSYYFPAINNEV